VGLDDLRAVKPGDNATHPMTVCFVDIRGFTARTARVGANAAFRSLNVLFTELGEVVAAHGGIIDKYLGDGMLVLFPGRVTDAYRAAVEMQRRARTVVAPDGGERMQIGIGMHTGDVVVGAVGHPERMDISVVSPVVNLASRLQEMARGLSCDIVLTEELRASLPPDMQAGCRPLLRHAIRGDIGERTLYEAFEALEPARAEACRRSVIALEELTHEAARGRWSTVAAQLPMLQGPDDPTVDQLLRHARQRVAEGG
jgi:class 3 adenylate cyclase